MERTSHLRMAVTAKNLFLPQIYWLIIRNCMDQRVKEMILSGGVRVWEREFLTALEQMHLLAVPAPAEGFWSEQVQRDLLALIQSDDTPKDSTNLQEFVNQHPSLKGIFHNAKSRNTVPPPAEAVGLIAWNNGEELATDKPTALFFELLKNGSRAALLLLARHLTLAEITYEYLKATPLAVFHKYLSNSEFKAESFVSTKAEDHRTAPVNFCMQPLGPWFELEKDSPLRAGLVGLVAELQPSVPKTFSGDWRNQLPSDASISAIKKHIKVEVEVTGMDDNKPSKSGSNAANLVFVGPPGTGKSRMAALVAERIVESGSELTDKEIRALELSVNDKAAGFKRSENIAWIQFHPSYAYEDFVEGLRPVKNSAHAGAVRYVVTPGPLKALAQLASCYFAREEEGFDPEEYFIGITGLIKKSGSDFHLEIPTEYQIYGLEKRTGEFKIQNADGNWARLVDSGPSLAKTLLPKEHCQTEGYVEIRWIPKAEKGGNTRFVLVIDELNRGNPAKIFGEVLSLVENTKRLGVSDGSPVLLPYSKENLILPPNLSVICTMNLADRSLSVIDQAFRRRFRFVYLKPNFKLISDPATYKTITKVESKADLNKKIADYFDAMNDALGSLFIQVDRHIGHSFAFQIARELYSKNDPSEADLENAFRKIWNEELHSLIREIVGERDIKTYKGALAEELKKKGIQFPNGLLDSLESAVPETIAA